MRVGFRDHRGCGVPFAAALQAAGHDVSAAGEVLLIDHEAPGPVYDRFFRAHDRAFLYPHGANPLMFTMWPRRPEVRGHFVTATGQADLYAAHDGRPCEVVGWSFGPLLPWRATEGVKVLFAPMHADGYGWLPDNQLVEEQRVFDELTSLPVEVRVRRMGSPTPMHEDIDWADVVVAAPGTFPTLAISRGCPTVVYAQDVPPIERHPVTREEIPMPGYTDLLPMFQYDVPGSTLAEQIEAVCASDVAAPWRERWIGDAFDPDAFADVFVKAVESW